MPFVFSKSNFPIPKKPPEKKGIAKSRGLQWCHEKYFWIFNVDCLTWFLIVKSISVCFLDNLIYIWHQVHCTVKIRKAVVYNLVKCCTSQNRILLLALWILKAPTNLKTPNQNPEQQCLDCSYNCRLELTRVRNSQPNFCNVVRRRKYLT